MPVSVRIEASLELPHRLDARIAVEHPQQFLFDRVASDSVFRQRTSSHCNDQSGQLDQHLASSCQLIVGEGNDIGVNVAIGDVPPNREIETRVFAQTAARASSRQIDRRARSCRRRSWKSGRRSFLQPHAAIDARGHGFAQLDESSGTRGVGWQHDLRRPEHARPIEQATSRVSGVSSVLSRAARSPRVAAERLSDNSICASSTTPVRWLPDAETPVDAVPAHDLPCDRCAFDRGDVQPLPIGMRHVARAARADRRRAQWRRPRPRVVSSASRRRLDAAAVGAGNDHDAERPFGADEQIDEIHRLGAVVTRGSLGTPASAAQG